MVLLADLPSDLVRAILESYLRQADWKVLLGRAWSVLRLFLGPSAGGDDGDAHGMVAQHLGLIRSEDAPTWKAVLDALQDELEVLRVDLRHSLPHMFTVMVTNLNGTLGADYVTGRFEALCRIGKPQLVQHLLARGHNPNIPYRARCRQMPLWTACLHCQSETVRRLIAHGADVNLLDAYSDDMALHHATNLVT